MQITVEVVQALEARFSPASIAEGIRHATRNEVVILDRQDDDYGLAVEGFVYNGRRELAVQLEIDSSGDWSAYCEEHPTAPCGHVAGIALVALSGRKESAKKPAPWQRALDAALPTAVPEPELCLFFSMQTPSSSRYTPLGTGRAPYLGTRPGVMGQRGSWIKGNTTWDSLHRLDSRSHRVSALLHLRHLQQLSASTGWYYYSTDWMNLSAVDGPDLWRALQKLREVGVAMIANGKAQHPLVLRESIATASVEVVRDKRKQLKVGAAIRDENGTVLRDVQLLGQPPAAIATVTAAGTADERVTISPLSAPLSPVLQDLLHRDAPLNVPAKDAEAFETDYLPRLQSLVPVASPDASYEIPAPPLNELVLSIQHARPQTHLRWEWSRPAGVADPAREAGIADAVAAAFSARPELLRAPGSPPTTALPERTLGQTSSVLFLTEVLPALRTIDGLRIVEESAPPQYREADAAPEVTVDAAQSGDWFDLHVSVKVGGESVEFSELLTALTLDEPVFVLPSGTFFSLDAPELARMREIVEEARALNDTRAPDEIRVSRYQVGLWSELADLGVVAAREAEWWLAMRSLTEATTIPNAEPPQGLRAELRDYQHTGYSWLRFLRTHGLGGILADDMGLGKTLQTIALFESERAADPRMLPYLVVAPTSVVGNWAKECARFAPELRVVTIEAMQTRRGQSLVDAVRGAHVVLTSYALFRLEAADYRELHWSGLILDEAQQIKNPASQGYRAARDLGTPFCLVITGTPIENNLQELWALSALSSPGLLGSRKRFTEYYRTPIERGRDADRLRQLQRRLGPFMLRRTKDLVASDLPPKQEQVLEVELHPRHRRTYDVHFQRERQRVLGLVDDIDANRFQIFRSLMHLRQLALSPQLVDAGDAPSAKLEALVELLTEAAAEGHRVLVLSQFTQFLRAARDHASSAGLASDYLDGSTPNRTAVIDGFRDGDNLAFFVSLKAGGFGLNLIEADYVVLLDPWWNPAVEEQAIDRTHRIGQTKPVFVYRLVSKDTIEHKVIALREAKAELFSRVLDGEAPFAPGAITADQLRELLE